MGERITQRGNKEKEWGSVRFGEKRRSIEGVNQAKRFGKKRRRGKKGRPGVRYCRLEQNKKPRGEEVRYRVAAAGPVGSLRIEND